MMPFEFTRPWLLTLLLVAAPVLIAFFVRSLSDFPRRQRIVSLVTRSLIVLLVILALAGFTLLRPTDEQFVMILADQSLSVGDDGAKRVNEYLDAALRNTGANRVAYLPFGVAPGIVQNERIIYGESPSLMGEQDKSPGAAKAPSTEKSPLRDGTNLAAAMEAAAGYLPPGYVPRIVVFTDGNETHGDALATASRSRMPISTVPLPTRSEPEVQVSEVKVPAEVREGEPFYVEVTVHSNHDDEGLIEVFRGDHKAISEQKKLTAGENVFRFQQSIERDRLAAFSARVSGLKTDTLLDNNMDSGLVFAAGKPRVLIIESDPTLIRDLAYALEDEGIQADIRPPQGMPETLSDLQNYELLMLSNVPATALTQQQMEITRTYVQELGGGFIMLGGEQSFGLGGYYKSTLEEILPVRSDFEKEKEKPSLGMVLVIDKSGSMDGDKIEMAKSAARSAAELLGNRDQVAVLAFDGDTYVISEMQSASNKGKISDEIGRIESGGGTTMYPAMEMANEILMSTPAKLKHVIILTDGVSSPGDFEGLAQQMTSAKITVSTVAVGEDSDTTLLDSIARIGKGRHYATTDPAQVPQIFAKETVTASKSAIDEQPFVPQVIRATHALREVDMESAPFLLGYVMTRPKPTCEVILATEKGDPLLAWWRYGLGMTAAFTSDAKSRWAAEWMTWPGFGKFWTQVIRQTMRKSDARGIVVDTKRQGGAADLTVDAVSDLGQFLNGAEVELTVIDPQLKREKSILRQAAPGRYVSSFPTPRQGAHHLEIALKQNGQVVYRQSRGLMVGYSDELRIKPTNEQLLKSVARVSGGAYAPPPESLFAATDQTVTRPTQLWPFLASSALALFILDVALRRIDFSLHWPFRSLGGAAPHLRGV
ncbi:MAG: VWA domain-containing protein [Planctomycetia bacterium]|nr:VWA domain-containing protein [Planctomycetia bacterium]